MKIEYFWSIICYLVLFYYCLKNLFCRSHSFSKWYEYTVNNMSNFNSDTVISCLHRNRNKIDHSQEIFIHDFLELILGICNNQNVLATWICAENNNSLQIINRFLKRKQCHTIYLIIPIVSFVHDPLTTTSTNEQLLRDFTKILKNM